MLLIQLGINSTCDVWQNFQTSLVLLIPNSTRHRMIIYTYSLNFSSIFSRLFSIFEKGEKIRKKVSL
jgi:hypothetical protein